MHVLITGGSRGIGRAVGLLAGQRGWDVSFTYVGNAPAAEETAHAIAAAGGRAFATRADSAVERDVISAFDLAIARFGPLDGFVNNAGVGTKLSPLADKSAEDMAQLVQLNVFGALLGAREAVRRMARSRGGKGGSIVNISSAAARLGSPNEFVDYAATKGAIDTLTIGLSREVAHEGLRVNAVRPGLIATDFHASVGWANRAEDMGKTIAFGRAGTAQETAEAVIWLLSEAASYVSGALLDVTGAR
jgi:NAD(P)-dependent dehydrogenase (short-subunit alcohol dehydrogenase family)